MYIHCYDPLDREMLHGMLADVYPFIDDAKAEPFADRIGVSTDGTVSWKRREWTEAEMLEYIAKLTAAFQAAFAIAKESQPPQEVEP